MPVNRQGRMDKTPIPSIPNRKVEVGDWKVGVPLSLPLCCPAPLLPFANHLSLPLSACLPLNTLRTDNVATG
jgi:hypothetical protein